MGKNKRYTNTHRGLHRGQEQCYRHVLAEQL